MKIEDILSGIRNVYNGDIVVFTCRLWFSPAEGLQGWGGTFVGKLARQFHLERKSASLIAVGTSGCARRLRVACRARIFEIRSLKKVMSSDVTDLGHLWTSLGTGAIDA